MAAIVTVIVVIVTAAAITVITTTIITTAAITVIATAIITRLFIIIINSVHSQMLMDYCQDSHCLQG